MQIKIFIPNKKQKYLKKFMMNPWKKLFMTNYEIVDRNFC